MSTAGEQANGESHLLGTSRDFRHVLFRSVASNLVSRDTNAVEDFFIRDRDTDGDGVLDEPEAVATIRVSIGTAGEQANAGTAEGRISASGRFVLFSSGASTLVPGDTNAATDAFLHDRDSDLDGVFDETGAVRTTRVSTRTDGAQAEGASSAGVMSPDGRFVVFASTASNLWPVSPGSVEQLYREDLVTRTLTLVSHAPTGAPADAQSAGPTMSDDGRIVAFSSEARNLGASDGGVHIYVRNLVDDTMLVLPTLDDVRPKPSDPFPGYPVPVPSPGVVPDGGTVFFVMHSFGFWARRLCIQRRPVRGRPADTDAAIRREGLSGWRNVA